MHEHVDGSVMAGAVVGAVEDNLWDKGGGGCGGRADVHCGCTAGY